MDSPLIRDAALVISGQRILDVGEAASIADKHPDAQVIEFGDAIVLPGLINAHTHLELSHCQQGEPPDSFLDWILSIPGRRNEQTVEPAVTHGIKQCLKSGVTCVGDITQQIEQSRRVLAASPLRCVSYGEALGLGKVRQKFEDLLPQAIDTRFSSPRLRIGLSPHAPYTVDQAGYEKAFRVAIEQNLLLATHLSENADERAFLESHSGPFRKLWETIGAWSDDVRTFPGSPIEMASAIGLIRSPTLLAHVNYCSDNELTLLARGRASVVYCPRTHRFFDHPPHRWMEMLEHGVNLTIGTDSCASTPDLNLVDELRLLHQIAPQVPSDTLWQLITTRAAKALQWNDEIGSLTPGKFADFVAFKTTSNNPLHDLIESSTTPCYVWINGEPAV